MSRAPTVTRLAETAVRFCGFRRAKAASRCDRFYGNGTTPAGDSTDGTKENSWSRAHSTRLHGQSEHCCGCWPRSWSPPCLAPTAGLVVVQASRQARCKMENEAWRLGEPASKRRRRHQQRSILGSSISKSFRNSERDAERRNPRARSRSAAARIGQAGATAGAADGAAVHDKPEQTRSRSEPTSGHIDLGAGSGSGAEQPPASTKRAKLIAMLERREGASVAEIGQRLGWLPHTVRAAITGLRKAGRAVTRNKEADDRSVYRLAPVDPASQR